MLKSGRAGLCLSFLGWPNFGSLFGSHKSCSLPDVLFTLFMAVVETYGSSFSLWLGSPLPDSYIALKGCHNTQHSDTQYNDIQPNNKI